MYSPLLLEQIVELRVIGLRKEVGGANTTELAHRPLLFRERSFEFQILIVYLIHHLK